MDWEEVADNLERIKVEGGWLYRSVIEIGSEEACSCSVALCFVPEKE